MTGLVQPPAAQADGYLDKLLGPDPRSLLERQGSRMKPELLELLLRTGGPELCPALNRLLAVKSSGLRRGLFVRALGAKQCKAEIPAIRRLARNAGLPERRRAMDDQADGAPPHR